MKRAKEPALDPSAALRHMLVHVALLTTADAAANQSNRVPVPRRGPRPWASEQLKQKLRRRTRTRSSGRGGSVRSRWGYRKLADDRKTEENASSLQTRAQDRCACHVRCLCACASGGRYRDEIASGQVSRHAIPGKTASTHSHVDARRENVESAYGHANVKRCFAVLKPLWCQRACQRCQPASDKWS